MSDTDLADRNGQRIDPATLDLQYNIKNALLQLLNGPAGDAHAPGDDQRDVPVGCGDGVHASVLGGRIAMGVRVESGSLDFLWSVFRR